MNGSGLSVQRQGGKFFGYKKTIGGKRFYFSRDLGIDRPSSANQKRAQRAAAIYAAEWERLKIGGATEWTTDALSRAKALVFSVVMGAAPTSAAQTPSEVESSLIIEDKPTAAPSMPSPTALMLHAGVDAYVERRRAQADAGQISGARADTIAYALRRFKLYAADRPLSQFGLGDCQAFVLHFASRPKQSSGTRKGQRLAPDTATDTIVSVRGFFEDAAERGEWSLPSSKPFKFDRAKLLTEQEQDDRESVQTFTAAQLTTLYQACVTDRQRLYVLLGLNCGFTQKEIATLRIAHCYLDATDKEGNPRPYIKRRRNKTRAKVKTAWRWRLWDETAELLRKEMAPDNAEGLALLSAKGGKLCDVTTSSRYDLVRGQWDKIRSRANRLTKLTGTTQAAADALESATSLAELVERTARLNAAMDRQGSKGVQPSDDYAKVPALGFKYLRKTAANMLRRIDARETAETFLAHAESGVGKVYHNPDFKRLAKALRRLRQRLEPMFATDKATKAPKANRKQLQTA